MAPDYCPDHGELMRAVGAIESSQKSLIEDVKSIRDSLDKIVIYNAGSRIRMAEMGAKVKLMYGGIGGALVIAATLAKDILVKRFLGQ
jgi:hypothetical protein